MIYHEHTEKLKNLKIYSKSIDIEITPENNIIFYNLDINDIPDVVNILYCDVTDIIDLFNSYEGGKLIEKVFNNEVILNIFPVDTTYIDYEERKYLIGHESLLKRHNVNFYQIWFDHHIQFKYHLGSTIHEALFYFIEKYRNHSFDYSKKDKHFLTLNNVHTPSREILYKFYNSLNSNNKNKFVGSFVFENIKLENEIENFNTIFNDFSQVFGTSIFPYYESCLIEIICESSHVAVTEKSFKALLSGLPIIWWNFANGPEYPHQIKIFDTLGIDTRYFGIDYADEYTIAQKVNELLGLSIEEIMEKYKDDFIKAQENKKKVFEYIDTITNDIIKK